MTDKVLIFDSGVGGLSVLKEIHQQQPQLNLHYLMDNAAFPYGTKDDEFLTNRIIEVCCNAVALLKPDILVIACNTASTLALPQLRELLNIPVVGVVPAIKTAAQLSDTDVIGLVATPATVSRPYTDNLINDFAPHCKVHRLGSSELVYWAEGYINHGILPSPEQLQEHLQPWLASADNVSHVVLGCTHFPLLSSQFKQLWPNIGWVDSGNAIAARVASLLACPTDSNTKISGTFNLYWTDENATPSGVASFLNQLGRLSEQRFVQLNPVIADKAFV